MCEKEEKLTNARIHAVTPVPHDVTTGLSNEIPAKRLKCFRQSKVVYSYGYIYFQLQMIVWHHIVNYRKDGTVCFEGKYDICPEPTADTRVFLLTFLFVSLLQLICG